MHHIRRVLVPVEGGSVAEDFPALFSFLFDLKVASKSTMSRCLVEMRGRAKWCLLHRNRESTPDLILSVKQPKKNSHMT